LRPNAAMPSNATLMRCPKLLEVYIPLHHNLVVGFKIQNQKRNNNASPRLPIKQKANLMDPPEGVCECRISFFGDLICGQNMLVQQTNESSHLE